MKIRQIVFTLIFGLLATGVVGQVDSFTPDSSKFFDEVEDLLGELKKQETKEFMKEFEPIWFGGKFTEAQRLKVYQTANKMLAERLRPWPDFHAYLYSLMSFVASGQSESSFNSWMTTIDLLLDGKNKKNFSKFIEFSSHLFSDNNLYQTTSTVWQSSKNNYEFKYEGDDPYVVFEDIDLRCFAKGDSMVIYSTSGTYYPLTLKWYGENGKISWVRAGLDENTTYAVFEHPYELGLKSTNVHLDSVLFYNEFFDEPLLGELTDKALSANLDPDKASYPQFDSYDKRLEIRDIVEGADYDGGFVMQGASFIGSGTYEDLARMIFYRDDVEFLRIEALTYFIHPERMEAGDALATIYLEHDGQLDSIVHINVQFKYQKDEKLVTLIRTDEGISRSPFVNTYHKMDMYFESLSWHTEDEFMEFKPLFQSTATAATFESFNYYTQRRFDDLFGLDDRHVLVVIRDLCESRGFWEFAATDLANAMKKSAGQVRQVLMTLTNQGYVYYDTESDWVYVKDKTMEHILARSGKTDYDILQFNSEIKTLPTIDYNARMNLGNYDLVIEGVQKVFLSDTQAVAIYPHEGRVTVQENRDFAFAGRLNAGKVSIMGTDFTFDYDEFKVNMLETKFMAIGAYEFGEYEGHRPLVTVQTYIEGFKGTLYVDNPYNKSGLDTSFNWYPYMRTTTESYAYYDHETIHGGLYNRDDFYFRLDTFTMDSLDEFTNAGIAFDGLFHSGGIFPDFRETLGLMADYSLGFLRKAPEDGFEMYEDVGAFNNTIALSANGLQGDGEIDFLSSHAESHLFTFFPDSTVGVAQTYTNMEQSGDPEVPYVDAVDIYVRYIPDEDILYASTIDSMLHFFGDQADMEGTIAVQQSGMTGQGIMRFEDAELSSNSFHYGTAVIDADTAEFKLLDYETDLNEMAFRTENVNAHVDFDARFGEFESNTEQSYVEFPDNQYICYMDYFKWFMDQDELELAHRGKADVVIDYDMALTGSNFYSVHPDQDSLNFIAPKAVYSLKDKEITCKEIPFILVADVMITPDSNKIVIHKKAKIETLENAQILANATNRYHQIFNASVDIYARMDYQASGDYIYVDENKMEQKVHFNSITTDSTLQTFAVGQIDETHNFTLSPQFEFVGQMELWANNRFMVFTGATRVSHDCEGIARNWMNFSAEIDPNAVYIPVGEDLVDQLNNPIGAGIIMGDSAGVYSTFLSMKQSKDDPSIISSSGLLYYDKAAKEYQIGNKEKLVERSLPGNFISMNIESCEVSGDGEFGFGANLHQVHVTNVGELSHNMVTNEMLIDASMVIDFHMNDDAMKKMVQKILDYPDLEAFDITQSTYEKALREIIGLEDADKIIQDLALKGKAKMPKELESTLVIGSVNFKWNAEENAFQSYGKIGLMNSGKELVMKEVDGYIEIQKERSGKDKITIYLRLDDNNWWYFAYDRGLMKVVSSDQAFNADIQETKPDDRKSKGEKGEDNYQYMLDVATNAKKFNNRMEDANSWYQEE